MEVLFSLARSDNAGLMRSSRLDFCSPFHTLDSMFVQACALMSDIFI